MPDYGQFARFFQRVYGRPPTPDDIHQFASGHQGAPPLTAWGQRGPGAPSMPMPNAGGTAAPSGWLEPLPGHPWPQDPPPWLPPQDPDTPPEEATPGRIGHPQEPRAPMDPADLPGSADQAMSAPYGAGTIRAALLARRDPWRGRRPLIRWE